MMDVQKYDAKKFRKIVDTTLSNYANMIKRLERKKNVSEFILIYYSMFLVITTLTGKYFPDDYNVIISEYFSIILSVIVLIYSLINKNSNYSSRIEDILDSLNKLKTIKRELDDENIEKFNNQYNEIVDKTERRNDVDFFITVKHLCKEYNLNWITKKRKKDFEKDNEKSRNLSTEDLKECIKQEKVVNNYISEINIFVEEGKIIFEVFWNCFLFLIPIILFLICLLKK